jgi:hypothetical protein
MELLIENVTPKKAEAWLNANNSNRKLRAGVAEKYADDMRNGRWTECPVPIAFYADGELADGQHRLWAIVEADVSIKFPIARGLTREAGLNIDTGLTRSLVDNARISGADRDLSNELLSVARAIEDGSAANKGNPRSNSERLALVEKHRGAAKWTVTHGPRGRGLRSALTLGAIGRAYYHENDLDRLIQFSNVLSSGHVMNADTDSAAITIRNYLLNRGQFTSGTWRDTFLKVQNAIRYFMRGQKLTIIKGVGEEAYPPRKAIVRNAPMKRVPKASVKASPSASLGARP